MKHLQVLCPSNKEKGEITVISCSGIFYSQQALVSFSELVCFLVLGTKPLLLMLFGLWVRGSASLKEKPQP